MFGDQTLFGDQTFSRLDTSFDRVGSCLNICRLDRALRFLFKRIFGAGIFQQLGLVQVTTEAVDL